MADPRKTDVTILTAAENQMPTKVEPWRQHFSIKFTILRQQGVTFWSKMFSFNWKFSKKNFCPKSRFCTPKFLFLRKKLDFWGRNSIFIQYFSFRSSLFWTMFLFYPEISIFEENSVFFDKYFNFWPKYCFFEISIFEK